MKGGLRGVFAALMCGALALSAPAVRAAGEEDYAAGMQSYQAQDFIGAMKPLQKAVDVGNTDAMVLLGRILDWGEEDERAVALYRRAAELGNPEGMVLYAVMLSSGDGVKKDAMAARTWVLKAVDADYEDAVNMMAMAHLKGDLGFTEADANSPEALAWMQRSAKQDYLPAIDALVFAYQKGGILGVEKNPALAAEYQKQAYRVRDIDPNADKKRKRRR